MVSVPWVEEYDAAASCPETNRRESEAYYAVKFQIKCSLDNQANETVPLLQETCCRVLCAAAAAAVVVVAASVALFAGVGQVDEAVRAVPFLAYSMYLQGQVVALFYVSQRLDVAVIHVNESSIQSGNKIPYPGK